MRLTVYTDFALRLLIYVAVHPEPYPTIAEIAASYGVSRNHMMKVAYDLGVACYIETVRGKNGGLRLARAPEAISLGELVRRTEPDFDLVECSNAASGRCAITPACRLRGVLHRAKAAFLVVLEASANQHIRTTSRALRAAIARRRHRTDDRARHGLLRQAPRRPGPWPDLQPGHRRSGPARASREARGLLVVGHPDDRPRQGPADAGAHPYLQNSPDPFRLLATSFPADRRRGLPARRRPVLRQVGDDRPEPAQYGIAASRGQLPPQRGRR